MDLLVSVALFWPPKFLDSRRLRDDAKKFREEAATRATGEGKLRWVYWSKYTFWLLNIAAIATENDPFIDDVPSKSDDFHGYVGYVK